MQADDSNERFGVSADGRETNVVPSTFADEIQVTVAVREGGHSVVKAGELQSPSAAAKPGG